MEGPSLVLLREELSAFVNKKVTGVSGNTKQDIAVIEGKKIVEITSWGKHLLIQFRGFYLRIHFLLFGSYRINEKKGEQAPRLSLTFSKGELNFYSCSVKIMEGSIHEDYDWKTDLMSEAWNEKHAYAQVKKLREEQVCDVLLNQDVFSGAGNIIKNEVLFIHHMHPETLVKDLTPTQVKKLIRETRDYSYRFYEWKKIFELRKHWLIYKKKKCPRCGIPVLFRKTGKGERGSYYCSSCQIRYQK